MAWVVFGKIRVELRSATLADARTRERIVNVLRQHYATEDNGLVFHFRLLGRLITQSITSENLPFPLSLEMTAEETVRAWECFDQMQEAFVDKLYETLDDLTKPVDEALGPEPLPEGADPKAKRGAK